MTDLTNYSLPIYPDTSSFQVAQNLGTTRFGCDLSICKGACCTMPGALGAPILESEIAELERVLPMVTESLQVAAHDVIAQKGVWQREEDGSITIPTIGGHDCIFVMYQSDIAICAIEHAYRNGIIEGFPKPISCHLFPIRIYPTDQKETFEIVYEEIEECAGGRRRGKKEKIELLDFLELPMVRALGEERVTLLRKALIR